MPWSSMSPPSGSTPTCSLGPAPWVLPKVWPPAISATVSSSFIAIRRKVSRMSFAALTGSGSPLGLGAPVDVVVRLPHVLATTAESESLEAHRLQRDVAGEDHQIRPGDLAAVLLLHRPEKATRLVQVPVVRPAVQRGEPLLPSAAAAAPVADPVRARGVPGHANHQRSVVTEVGRPPGLRVGHDRREVLLQSLVVDALELLRVVELLAHRVGAVAVLVQQLDVQRIRPPVLVRRSAASDVVDGALGFVCHGDLLSRWAHPTPRSVEKSSALGGLERSPPGRCSPILR